MTEEDKKYIDELRDKGYKISDDLSNIVVPDGIKEIEPWAFCNFEELEHIELPDSIDTIGEGAFADCISLKEISIPYNVRSIENFTFENCDSLTEIDIPEDITYIGVKAFRGTDIRRINIPDSVTEIGNLAFANCNSLMDMTIPESVTHIGTGAFYGSNSLLSLYVPADLDISKAGIVQGCDVEKYGNTDNYNDYDDDYNEDHELDTDDENSAYYTGSYDYDGGGYSLDDFFESMSDSKKKLFNNIYKRFN